MQTYPIDHPLRRIQLAYLERFDDSAGLRYAFTCFVDAMAEFELEPQEFEDAIELFVDDILYDEDETALSCVLHAIKVLVIKTGFPLSRLPHVMDRLEEVKVLAGSRGLVCFFLMELYVAIWAGPVDDETARARAYEAIKRLASDNEDVVRLKSVIKSLGLLMAFRDAGRDKRDQAFCLMREAVERNGDWRIYAYTAQSMQVAFSQGHIDPSAAGELIDWLRGFLTHEYEVSLYAPVGECLLQALQSCELNDAQVRCCLESIFYIVQHAQGVSALRTLLRIMGLSLHWHYLNEENDALCLKIHQHIFNSKWSQDIAIELAGSIAEVLVNPPKVRESPHQTAWVDLLVETIVRAQCERGFSLMSKILDTSLVKDVFDEKHYKALAEAVFDYCDVCQNREKLPLRALGLLDVLLGLGYMPEECLDHAWNVMTQMLSKKLTRSTSLGLWSVVLEGLVSFVAFPRLSVAEREDYYDNLDALIQSRKSEPLWLGVFGRVYGILLGVKDRVPTSRLNPIAKRLIELIAFKDNAVQALGWSGLEAALIAGALEVPFAEQAAGAVVDAFKAAKTDETRVNIIRVWSLLTREDFLPESLRSHLLDALKEVDDAKGEWYLKKYMEMA
ncbi:MAG: hypothetical protein Tsb0018_04580 [Opitutales bacterium]